MEQASLRSVPLRPAGPVDPAEAVAHVRAALPALDEPAVAALALVEIAGRSRAQAAEVAGLDAAAVADALTRARKALRRSIFPLSASGWCERAERLISDRLDDELAPPGARRLQVHLGNCERCVEHERRLAQAREQLVRSFIDAHPHAEVVPPPARAVPLRVVRPELDVPAPVFDAGTPAAPATDTERAPDRAGGGPAEIGADPLPEDPPLIEREIAPAEPADATSSETAADEAAPPVEEDAPAARSARAPARAAASPVRSPASVAWTIMHGAAVMLAVLTVVLLVAALAGVERVL